MVKIISITSQNGRMVGLGEDGLLYVYHSGIKEWKLYEI
jgi:hypothetical protein